MRQRPAATAVPAATGGRTGTNYILCVPIFCECRERLVWAVDIHWLSSEGLKINTGARVPLEPKPLKLPTGAINVTGQFTVRCPHCLTRLHVLSLIRSRLAAGAGMILTVPSDWETPVPARQPRPEPPKPGGKGARLLGCDGRRTPRVTAAPDLCARASITFDLTVVDISVLGMLASHTHEVQLNVVYGLRLRLAPGMEAIQVAARAVWTVPHASQQMEGSRRTVYRTGFEFVHVETDVALALEGYVTRSLGRHAQGFAEAIWA